MSGSQASDKNLLLPVPRTGTALPAQPERRGRLKSLIDKRKNLQVVSEFRNKLKVAEDLISKLAFSLREIQDTRRKRPKKEKGSGKSARILPVKLPIKGRS